MLLILAIEADRDGMCNPSTRAIADEADTTAGNVHRTLDRLRDRGLVSWTAGAGRAPNTYRLPIRASRPSDQQAAP
ncbi:MAG: hypothetical protein ACRDS1_00680 [Pseudonocardiaceae bacterium]